MLALNVHLCVDCADNSSYSAAIAGLELYMTLIFRETLDGQRAKCTQGSAGSCL